MGDFHAPESRSGSAFSMRIRIQIQIQMRIHNINRWLLFLWFWYIYHYITANSILLSLQTRIRYPLPEEAYNGKKQYIKWKDYKRYNTRTIINKWLSTNNKKIYLSRQPFSGGPVAGSFVFPSETSILNTQNPLGKKIITFTFQLKINLQFYSLKRL